MEYLCNVDSAIGRLAISGNGQALTGLWIENQKYFADTLSEEMVEEDLPVFQEAREWLSIYFFGKEPDFTPPLAPKGSEFRQAVWRILCEIPYGKVITYGDIAKQIAKETGKEHMSAQAVGGAVGHNPISIIIPCHRVVGSDGSLTGYAGGISKKVQLLQIEGTDMENLYVPKKGTAL